MIILLRRHSELWLSYSTKVDQNRCRDSPNRKIACEKKKIGRALCSANSCNIIHRHLTPENLLLDSRGRLRLPSFSFAKIVDNCTWTLGGTTEYLAPEIIQLLYGADVGGESGCLVSKGLFNDIVLTMSIMSILNLSLFASSSPVFPIGHGQRWEDQNAQGIRSRFPYEWCLHCHRKDLHFRNKDKRFMKCLFHSRSLSSLMKGLRKGSYLPRYRSGWV